MTKMKELLKAANTAVTADEYYNRKMVNHYRKERAALNKRLDDTLEELNSNKRSQLVLDRMVKADPDMIKLNADTVSIYKAAHKAGEFNETEGLHGLCPVDVATAIIEYDKEFADISRFGYALHAPIAKHMATVLEPLMTADRLKW